MAAEQRRRLRGTPTGRRVLEDAPSGRGSGARRRRATRRSDEDEEVGSLQALLQRPPQARHRAGPDRARGRGDLRAAAEARRRRRGGREARQRGLVLDRHRGRLQRAGLRAPTWRCSAACSAGRETTRSTAGSTCAPPTRSRWPAWPPRASSRPRAPAASCSPTGRCARRACRAGARPAGWSPSSSLTYWVYLTALVMFGILLRTHVLPGNAPFGGTSCPPRSPPA